ncbi:hypothetical protein Syun_011806 [Stephania yunnanensis]|uniref:Uncharacterized protein n=1 Tax=Stephania yunnanensis TaxID=152371 RepID=A0AAP0PIU6_9MAGN
MIIHRKAATHIVEDFGTTSAWIEGHTICELGDLLRGSGLIRHFRLSSREGSKNEQRGSCWRLLLEFQTRIQLLEAKTTRGAQLETGKTGQSMIVFASLSTHSPHSPQQSTTLEDMMKKLVDDQQRFHEELQQISREFPSLQNLENQLIQVNATLQNMLDEKELCNTQPISYLEENVDVDTLSNVEENVDVDTLSNVEENVDTLVENYWCETTQGLEVLQIEPNMSIAPNDDEAALEIGVISERQRNRR